MPRRQPQASPGTLRTGDRGTGRLDPILSRSLMLAGLGLGLMALGRALALGLEAGGGSTHSGQSDVVANPTTPPGIPAQLGDSPPRTDSA